MTHRRVLGADVDDPLALVLHLLEVKLLVRVLVAVVIGAHLKAEFELLLLRQILHQRLQLCLVLNREGSLQVHLEGLIIVSILQVVP